MHEIKEKLIKRIVKEDLSKDKLFKIEHYYNFERILKNLNLLNILSNDKDKSEILNCSGIINNLFEKYNLALEKYTESLRIKRAIYGSDEHSSIATTLGCIGSVYDSQAQYNLALEKYTESLRIYRAIYGSDEHPDIKIILNNIKLLNNNKCCIL